MRTALALLLVAGALAPATSAVWAQSPPAGGVSIRLAEAPADRRDDPRASIYVIDHVKPGTVVRRKLAVGNREGRRLDVAVYAGAAEVREGEFVPAAGRTQNELSTWTSVSRQQLQLAPGQDGTVEATIAVPRDASAGERYAVIWAEIASGTASGVRQVNRVGIRLYLSVGPGGEPASDFTVGSLTAGRLASGEPVVYARVQNTGGRALDMSGALGLRNGPGGLSAGPFPAKLGTTLGLGQTERVTVVLDKALPAGPWQARIDLASGLTKRSAQATVTFPDEAGAGMPVSASPVPREGSDDRDKLPPVPLIAAGVLVTAVVLALALSALRARGRLRPRRAGGRQA